MLSHLLPYLLFVAPHSAEPLIPVAARPWIDPVRTVATGIALIVFWRRGAYPELRRTEPAARGATGLALASGVAVALLWMPLAVIVPQFGAARGWFCPEVAGPDAAPYLWASRLIALVLVIPFAEELFVRSLIPRWMDAMDAWRTRPIGLFTPLSAAVSIGFFTLTHPEWLAALVTAALWTGLVVRTRRLGDAVLAHVVANGLLAVWWLHLGDRSWW